MRAQALDRNWGCLTKSVRQSLFLTLKKEKRCSLYRLHHILHRNCLFDQIRHRTRVRKIHANAVHLVALASILSRPPRLDLFI